MCRLLLILGIQRGKWLQKTAHISTDLELWLLISHLWVIDILYSSVHTVALKVLDFVSATVRYGMLMASSTIVNYIHLQKNLDNLIHNEHRKFDFPRTLYQKISLRSLRSNTT